MKLRLLTMNSMNHLSIPQKWNNFDFGEWTVRGRKLIITAASDWAGNQAKNHVFERKHL